MRPAEMSVAPHSRNLALVMQLALRLAEEAGNEADATRRAELIARAMLAWRAAQRLRRWRP